MELSQVEAFLTLHQIGNFSRAAEALHLSQPAMSRRISMLETFLEASLFNRGRGRTTLTAAGEAFLPHAQRIKAAVSDGHEAVRESCCAVPLTARLGLVGTLASSPLTAALQAFRAQHPEAQLNLRTARSREISHMVLTGETHLGLRYFADRHPDLRNQIAGEETLVVVTSAKATPPDDPEMLFDYLHNSAWVGFPAGGSGEHFARHIKNVLHDWGVQPDRWADIDSINAQKRWVEAGFGVAMLPITSIEEERKLKSLRVIESPRCTSTIPITLLTRRDALLTSAAEKLRAFLLTHLKSSQ